MLMGRTIVVMHMHMGTADCRHREAARQPEDREERSEQGDSDHRGVHPHIGIIPFSAAPPSTTPEGHISDHDELRASFVACHLGVAITALVLPSSKRSKPEGGVMEPGDMRAVNMMSSNDLWAKSAISANPPGRHFSVPPLSAPHPAATLANRVGIGVRSRQMMLTGRFPSWET